MTIEKINNILKDLGHGCRLDLERGRVSYDYYGHGVAVAGPYGLTPRIFDSDGLKSDYLDIMQGYLNYLIYHYKEIDQEMASTEVVLLSRLLVACKIADNKFEGFSYGL